MPAWTPGGRPGLRANDRRDSEAIEDHVHDGGEEPLQRLVPGERPCEDLDRGRERHGSIDVQAFVQYAAVRPDAPDALTAKGSVVSNAGSTCSGVLDLSQENGTKMWMRVGCLYNLPVGGSGLGEAEVILECSYDQCWDVVAAGSVAGPTRLPTGRGARVGSPLCPARPRRYSSPRAHARLPFRSWRHDRLRHSLSPRDRVPLGSVAALSRRFVRLRLFDLVDRD